MNALTHPRRGVRLRRCQIPAAATGGGLDHGRDRKGTYGDPFGLRCTTSRRLRAGNDATVAGEPTSCSAAGRPILAWAPGEDGPNLRRTTPKNPVRVTSGRTRLLPADWAPGGRQAPRNSHGLPESRSRESRPTTRRPLNLTVATAGCATHRPAVRRPDPSALLAGTPTRISRSNRVGPSGRSAI